MSIERRELEGGVWLVEVAGRLDQSMTPALEATFDDLLESDHNRLIVDLSGVTYINSGGLRCLVAAWRRARRQEGDLFICGLKARVDQVFSMVGFDKVFNIYQGQQDAAKAWQEAA